MLKNTIKITVRNILNNRIFSIINISGLAIGVACFLLIFLYLRFEHSYDGYHVEKDRIYRVIKECGYPGGIELRADSGAPMAPALLENFPEITAAVRFTTFYESLIGYNHNVFSEDKFYFADPSVFTVFSYPLTAGDPERALSDPFSVVISPESAEKYFGAEDPIGKVLACRFSFRKEKLDLKVTGVFQKIPENSHFDFDFLASFETLRHIVSRYYLTERWDSTTYNYILLDREKSPGDLEERLQAFATEVVDKGPYTSLRLRLQPLKDVYFRSWGVGGGVWKSGNLQMSYGFMALAIFILILACVNFMNLSTARAADRAKEVGLRKVLGAQRSSLILQFFAESIFFSTMGLILALIPVRLFLPVFKNITQTDLKPPLQSDPMLLIFLAVLAVVVGLFAGSYPALVLSGFRPVKILKGVLSADSSDFLRKALVVFQFAVTVFLVIGSLIVFKQMHFIRNKNLGFHRQNLIVIPIQEISAHEKLEVLKTELVRSPNISGVTALSTIPGIGSQNGIKLKAEGIEEVDMGIIYVDRDFVETMEIEIADGRAFQAGRASDAENAFLVNQSCLKRLEWDYALGRSLELFYKQGDRIIPRYEGRVIGVLRDFNFRELNVPIQPVIFKIDPNNLRYILVRINGDDVSADLASLETIFKTTIPNHPFEFSFLDAAIEEAYQRERTFLTIMNYATVLAIVVAGLGLFGLTLFTTKKRTKEIGIRKVLGASEGNIVILLTKDFLKLVLIANLIAWPIGYWVMSSWLQDFAYRTSFGVLTVFIAGILSLTLALGTVAFQAVRAALAHPADSLRYE